jgi:hypothetical protein
MDPRERLLACLAAARAEGRALAGIRIHSFGEGEAAAEAAEECGVPVVLMVSAQREHLGALVAGLRSLGTENVFLQVAGDDPGVIAAAAREVAADALYWEGSAAPDRPALMNGLAGCSVLTEVVLPWRRKEAGEGVEGRIADMAATREVIGCEDVDVVAVPVGGRPGPYKSWRFPLWSLEAFSRIIAMRPDRFYSLPWGSVLPKEEVKRYNLYGGALPGIHSFPRRHFQAFIGAGAVKVNFSTDSAITFLGGVRESLLRKPEVVEVHTHLEEGRKRLTAFLKRRLKELGAAR